MKRLFSFTTFILIITALFYSCEKDNQDNDLLNDLTGTWRYEIGSITFNNNGEYIDSMFGVYYTDSLMSVIEGNYNLKDDYIELHDLKYTYRADLSGTLSKHFLFPDYKFQIVDKILSMTQTGVFEPLGHNGNTINGLWESHRLIVVHDTRQTPTFLSGDQIMRIDISESTKEYTITYKDTYGTEQDSLIRGPYNCIIVDNEIYSESSSKPFATYTNGMLIKETGTITYNKLTLK